MKPRSIFLKNQSRVGPICRHISLQVRVEFRGGDIAADYYSKNKRTISIGCETGNEYSREVLPARRCTYF